MCCAWLQSAFTCSSTAVLVCSYHQDDTFQTCLVSLQFWESVVLKILYCKQKIWYLQRGCNLSQLCYFAGQLIGLKVNVNGLLLLVAQIILHSVKGLLAHRSALIHDVIHKGQKGQCHLFCTWAYYKRVKICSLTYSSGLILAGKNAMPRYFSHFGNCSPINYYFLSMLCRWSHLPGNPSNGSPMPAVGSILLQNLIALTGKLSFCSFCQIIQR